MSGEQVVGHVNWSPDFGSNRIEKLLSEGKLKIEPHYTRGKLVSFDVVAGELEPQEEAPDLRPHQEGEEKLLTLIGPGGSFPREVTFTYTNWKGESKQRKAVFTSLHWGSNEWHKKPQMLVNGYDLDKKAPRTYAVNDISDLKPL